MHNTAANNNTTNSPSTPTKNPKGIEFFFTPGASLERVRERIRNKKYYGYYMTDEELDEFSGPHYPETDDPEMIQNQLGEPDYYGIPESKPQSGRIPSPHFDSSPKIPINEKVSLLQFDETQNETINSSGQEVTWTGKRKRCDSYEPDKENIRTPRSNGRKRGASKKQRIIHLLNEAINLLEED